MLTCAICGRPLRECCDIYYEATDEQGRDCVLCGDCADELDAEEERHISLTEEQREQVWSKLLSVDEGERIL